MSQKGKGRFFYDIILLLIAETPTYGYELISQMKAFGIDLPNEPGAAGRIYSTLKNMEKKSQITANWDTSTAPPRKIYTISNEGKKYLQSSESWIKEQIRRFTLFQRRWKNLDLD